MRGLAVRCERCGAAGASHFADSSVLCTKCAGIQMAVDYAVDRGHLTMEGLPQRNTIALYTHAACSAVVAVIGFSQVDADARFVLWTVGAIFGGIVPAAIVAPWRRGPAVIVAFHVVVPALIFGLIGRLAG